MGVRVIASFGRLVRREDGRVLLDPVRVARGFFDRLRGLLGREGLAAGEGLWLEPCGSIHMFGMRFPIDAVFLDGEGEVLALAQGLAPGWRFARCPGARATIEGEAGWIRTAEIRRGDHLLLTGIPR